jgi:hypothetical protein
MFWPGDTSQHVLKLACLGDANVTVLDPPVMRSRRPWDGGETATPRRAQQGWQAPDGIGNAASAAGRRDMPGCFPRRPI